MRNPIKTVNTFLLEEILPYYLECGCVTHGWEPEFVVKILQFPPVKAVIRGLSRLLSLYRFYYAPEPEDETDI
jgi:hypothetical protein